MLSSYSTYDYEETSIFNVPRIFDNVTKNRISFSDEDEEKTFEELANNPTLILNLQKARKNIRNGRTGFINFTEKYSDLIS